MFLPLLLAAAALSPRASFVPVRQAPGQAGAPSKSNSDAARAQAELVKGLLGLAGWANQNELFLQRDLVWRSVLALEPENVEARKGLRYSRDGVGHWKEPPAREVKDRKPALMPEFTKRRTELVSAWRARVLAALESEKAERALREAAYSEILRVDPEDEVVHGLRGEVRGEKGWLLGESVASRARRAELQKLVQDALQAAVETQPAEASKQDLGYLPAWKLVRSCEGVRILLQTTEEEARAMLQVEHAARVLLREVCGKPLAPSPGFSAYVLVDPTECEKFAASLADGSEAEKQVWRLAHGFGIPHRAAVVVWDPDPKCRLDCFTRHLVASCSYAGFGIEARHGWLVEGLGLYLTHALTGTWDTWFRPDQAGDERTLKKRLQSAQSDWIAEARKLVPAGSSPKLIEVLAKPVGTLTIVDMLVSTAFAAYLVEAQPKALPEILDRVGRGGGPAETIAAVAGRPFPEVEARFVRWLDERK